MNKLMIALLACMLALSVLPSSCVREEMIKKEDMPGGLRDRTWEDAPKTIQSKEILRFECEFGFNDRQDGGYFYCIFGMEADDQKARWRMEGYDGWYELVGLDLEAPPATLDALQAMVDQLKLVRHNGLDRQVSGLPEHYGSRLLIEYVSGERVYAYDNSTSFLGHEEKHTIHDFFCDLARESGHPIGPGETD